MSAEASSGAERVRARTVDLARRLNLLQDWFAGRNGGKPMTFTDLRTALAEHGQNLSEGRWGYMLSGDGSLCTDRALLIAVARVYGVSPDFLTDWDAPDLPDDIAAGRDLVQEVRETKLVRLATRSLGPLTDESREAIMQVIRSQMMRDFGEDDGR